MHIKSKWTRKHAFSNSLHYVGIRLPFMTGLFTDSKCLQRIVITNISYEVFCRSLIETVTQFKYLGSSITDDARSVQEIKIRIAVATASLAKLKVIWRDKSISMKTRMGLLRALITSIFLYGCETWTLNPEMEKPYQCFRDELHAQTTPSPLHFSYFQQAG